MILRGFSCFYFFVCFFETGFSLALEPVLELALVDQTVLELRDPSASASQVLGLKACATTAQHDIEIFKIHIAPRILTEDDIEAGEMAQWLRALTAIPEDPGSNTSTHMAAHNSRV